MILVPILWLFLRLLLSKSLNVHETQPGPLWPPKPCRANSRSCTNEGQQRVNVCLSVQRRPLTHRGYCSKTIRAVMSMHWQLSISWFAKPVSWNWLTFPNCPLLYPMWGGVWHFTGASERGEFTEYQIFFHSRWLFLFAFLSARVADGRRLSVDVLARCGCVY